MGMRTRRPRDGTAPTHMMSYGSDPQRRERELQNRGAEEEEVRLEACPCVKNRHKSHIKMKLKYSKQETFGAHPEPRTPLQSHSFRHWMLAEWSVLGQRGNQAK